MGGQAIAPGSPTGFNGCQRLGIGYNPRVTTFEKCGNCGAPLEVAADGRSVACSYCGASRTQAVDPVVLAASLRSESGTIEHLLDTLAERLGRELPELVRVQYRGGFLSAKRPESVEVTLENIVYALRHQGHRWVATEVQVVRGIVLKTETIPVDTWLVSLCQALSAHASLSARAVKALAGTKT